MSFRDAVYELVSQIPLGRVCAYGDIAGALGRPHAARQVGFALARLPLERVEQVPWHRVINAQGMISGRGDLMRPDLQRSLLEEEGVEFDARHRCDFKKYRFIDFGDVRIS